MPSFSSQNQRPFNMTFNTQGQNERDGIFFIQPDGAERIENLHMTKMGEWTAHQQGNINFSDLLASGSRIDGIQSFTDVNGITRMVVFCDGQFQEIHAGAGTFIQTLSTDGTSGNLMDGEAFQGNLYLTEKTMTPKKWDGITPMANASAFPITNGSDTYDKPQWVETFNNRLAFANFDGFPSHVAISDDLDPDTFTLVTVNDTDGIVMEISPGDGQTIQAMKTIYVPSLNETLLIVFKENSIHAVSGNTPTTFALQTINNTYGCLNNNCVVQVGSDLYFLDRNNIYSLTTAFQSGTLQPRVIGSARVQETLNTLNLSQAHKAWAAHLPDRQEIWFAIPTGSSLEVDTILVYRYPDNPNDPSRQAIWSLRTGMDTTCAQVIHKALYTGTTSGRIQKWFVSATYNGNPINWLYRFPFFNFGSPFQQKRLVNCYAWFLIRNTTSVNVHYKWRRTDSFKTSKVVTKSLASASGALYASATYGLDVYAGDAGGILAAAKIPIRGNGTQVQLEVSGLTGSTGPTFLGFTGDVAFGTLMRSYH